MKSPSTSTNEKNSYVSDAMNEKRQFPEMSLRSSSINIGQVVDLSKMSYWSHLHGNYRGLFFPYLSH